MILLEGQSLNRSRKIPLEALNVQLKERDSTATMTPVDMTGIGVNSWVQSENGPGAGSVWRVRSIRSDILTDTPQVQLEHMIGSLRDNIIFGEITPKVITGNSKATVCTADQAIRFILSHQDDWVLGSFDYPGVSNPYKFDGDSLYDALETVTNSLKDAWWSYNMSVYPFRLNITRKGNAVGSEMRAGRNLRTITRTIDKTAMYTRFYPIGNNDLHIDGDYLEENSEIYGVISKVETDASITTKAELERFAMERLRDHCEPTVTVDVEGLELADATGEPLDRLQLGAYCRIPLPEYGTTILERIVSLNYPDALSNPESVRITLGNNRTDVTKIISDAMKTGGKSRRAAARRDKQDNAWFEDTNEHVAMCAKGIVGTDAQGNPNWVRLSSIYVDGKGIHQQVQSVQNDVVLANTRIDMAEDAIELEANQRVAGEAVLTGKITVQADRITQEVTDRRNSDETLDGKITVEAGKITQIVSAVGKDGRVTAASICLAINSGGSSATINADKIYLLGQTIANTITADYVSAKIAAIPTLTVQSMSASGSVSAGTLNGDTIRFRHSAGAGYTYTDLKTAFVSSITLSHSGNTYTLKSYDANANETVIGSFSRAVSSWDWTGRNGQVIVTAQPQGQSLGVDVSVSGDNSITTNGTYTYKVQYEDDDGYKWDTGATLDVNVSVPGTYQNLGMYINGQAATSRTISEATTVDLMYTEDDYWFTIDSITLTPLGGSGTRYRLDCTAKTPSYPGSTLSDYTFKLSSVAGNPFDVGTVYDFYRF